MRKNNTNFNDIAIIGIACRTPMADNYQAFWENLINEVNCVGAITDERWATGKAEGRGIVKYNGMIDKYDEFDAEFFNISPREANNMDPQQRLLLEETWHCIEDAGIGLNTLKEKITSVYVGATGNDYNLITLTRGDDVDNYAGLGSFECMMANRVSHAFGFSGTSLTLDTACSSSLVALHEAKKALIQNECNYAFASGVCIAFHPWRYVTFSKARMMSEEGKCSTFDKAAKGFVQGEGVAILLLEHLDKAVENKHKIYGVIKGSSVNHCGNSLTIAAPKVESQKELIVKAYHNAGLNPSSTTYVEAHGTGTSLGDPIEIEALTQAFSEFTQEKQFCRIGSVKTNIGHTGGAAGLIGTIKVLLMMQNKKIVKTLNLNVVNPMIQFEDTPFIPAQKTEDWNQKNHRLKRLAGISAFGFGGVNAHVLIEEWGKNPNSRKAAKMKDGKEYLFILSAKNSFSLGKLIESWKRFVKTKEFEAVLLEQINKNLLIGREAFSYRCGTTVRSKIDIIDYLNQYQDTESQHKKINYLKIGDLLKLCDKFDFQFQDYDLFRSNVCKIINVLMKAGEKGMKYADALLKGGNEINDSILYKFSYGYVLVSSLMDLGIKIEKIICKKSGYLLGLVLSKAVSLEEMICYMLYNEERPILHIRRPEIPLFNSLEDQYMLPYKIDSGYLEFINSRLEVGAESFEEYYKKACVLYENQFTFKKFFEEWDKITKEHGFSLIESIQKKIAPSEFQKKEKLVFLTACITAIVQLSKKWSLSNKDIDSALVEFTDLIFNKVITKEEVVKHLLVNPLSLQDLTETLNCRQMLVSNFEQCKYLLAYSDKQIDIDNTSVWIEHLLQYQALKTEESSMEQICFGYEDGGEINLTGKTGTITSLLSELWLSGASFNWDRLDNFKGIPCIFLPGYEFKRMRYWMPELQDKAKQRVLHPMIDSNESTLYEQKFKKVLNADDFYLTEHIVGGQVILPGVAYLEMARAAGELAAGTNVNKLKDITWLKPLIYRGEDKEVLISISQQEKNLAFEIYTRDNQVKIVHAIGRMETAGVMETNVRLKFDPEKLAKEASYDYGHDFCYEDVFAKCIGFQYGIGFRATEKAYGHEKYAFEKLQLPKHLKSAFHSYVLHPSILDAALRAVTWLGGKEAYKQLVMHVPFSLESIEILGELTETSYSYAVINEGNKSRESGVCKYNLSVLDHEGIEVLRIKNFIIRQLKSKKSDSKNKLALYETQIVKKELQTKDRIQFDQILVLNGNAKDLAEINYYTEKFTTNPVIPIQFGTGFHKSDNGSYTINPVQSEDLTFLGESLLLGSSSTIGIIHFANLKEQGPVTETVIRENLNNSLYTVLNLYKLFTCNLKNNNIRYIMTDNGNDGRFQALTESASVFAKSILSENWKFIFSSISFGNGMGQKNIAKHLVNELFYKNSKEDCCVYYFDGQRRVERSIPYGVEKETSVMRNQGAYLITGAYGSLGRLTAGYLAKRYKSKLILCGRKELVQEQKEYIQELESIGGEVITVVCGFNSYEETLEMVKKAKEAYGSIQGVFHCAGITDPLSAANSTTDTYDTVFRTKIYGMYYLDEALRNENLDFVVAYSSISAVIGDYGRGSYAVANRFMDRFSAYRNRLREKGERFGHMVSINWPIWAEGHMKAEGEEDKIYQEYFGFRYLEKEEGFSALEQAAASNCSQMIVTVGEIEKIKSRLCHAELETVNAETVYSLPESNIIKTAEKYLKNIISKAAGMKAEDLHTTVEMSAYGIDSIMIMELNQLMDDDFENLSKTLFFEYRTIHALAVYLSEEYRDIIYRKGGQIDEKPDAVIHMLEGEAQNMLPAGIRFPMADPEKEIWTDDKEKSRDIAIIGLSGRYPMADTLEEFWENLKNGKDCITEVPKSRWDHDKYYSPVKGQKNKVYCKWGGFIDGIDEFDALFFGISPKEAQLIDPQERLFLQSVYEMMQDAGYTRKTLKDIQVGVFVGVMNGHYQLLGAEQLMKNNMMDIRTSYASIANRVSYYFNFHGPSIAVDTMCSSSLTAIHLACQSILNGECEQAVAGGVNVIIHPAKYVFLSEQRFGSSEGHCRAFGDNGDGYVPSEGVGAVLLKPLWNAVADGDHIYGVIKASSLNHGGKTNGYTVPNPVSQTALIQDALEKSGINPETIGYTEAHGTGTKLGDPIEVASLTKAFGTKIDKKQFCPIGSVKANIGHTESVAGLASLTKVLFQMKYGSIVPSILADTLNPNINFKDSPFYVEKNLVPWKRYGEDLQAILPYRAGISSFGAGGTNAYLLLEEYIDTLESGMTKDNKEVVIILSAADNEQLRAYAHKMASYLTEGGAVPTIEEEMRKKDWLRNMVSSIFHIPEDQIHDEDSLFEYGLQPIEILKITDAVKQKFEIEIEPNQISGLESIAKITEYLSQHMKIKAYRYNNHLLENIAYTLQTGREDLEYRMAFVTEDIADMIGRLEDFARGSNTGILIGTVNTNIPPKPVEDIAFEKYITGNSFLEIAELWIKGSMINWEKLYQSRPKKLSLATYPFKKEIYWIPEKADEDEDNGGMEAAALPLIDSISYDHSFEKGIVFTKRISVENILVKEHIVKNRMIVPGVVQLEMACEALSCITHSMFRIKNVEWLKALEIQADRDIFVKLSKNTEHISYEIFTEEEQNKRTSYSQGYFELFQDGKGLNQSESFDSAPYKTECKKEIENGQIYESFVREGICYGKYFRKIGRIQKSSSRMIVLMEEEHMESGNFYLCQPNALDASLQSLSAFVGNLGTGSSTTNVPYSIGEITVLLAGETIASAYVEWIDGRFDIKLLNKKEELCIELNDVVIKETKYTGMDGFYFEPIWKSALPLRNKITAGKVLILYDALFGTAAARLKQQYTNGDVYLYQMRGYGEDMYHELFQRRNGYDTIYFMDAPDGTETGNMGKACEAQILRLALFIKELIHNGYQDQYLHFKLVTNTVFHLENKEVNYQSAGLYGFMSAIDGEHKKWNVNCIDISAVDLCEDRLHGTMEMLKEEAGTAERNEILLSGGKRYIKEVQPVPLRIGKKAVLRDKGVYVLLGGANGIGFEVSRYLAEKYQASVIWIGRSAYSSDIAEKVSIIRALGGTAEYYRADGRNAAGLRQVFLAVKSANKVIHGVFHTAVVLSDGMFYNMDMNSFQKTLESKITTSINLAEAVKGEDLDFMVFFSSVQSVYGNTGQSNYAAGSTFQDIYAKYLDRSSGYPVKVINWGYWGTVGAVSNDTYNLILDKQGFHAIGVREGTEALQQIMDSDLQQVIVMKNGADTFARLMKSRSKPDIYQPQDHHEKEAVNGSSSADSGPDECSGKSKDMDIAGWIEGIIKKVLGIQHFNLDMEKQFIDYGVDSVNGLEIIEHINSGLKISIKTTALFDYPNIKTLSEYIVSHYLAADIEILPVSPEEQELTLLEKLAAGEVDMETVLMAIGE